MIKNDIYTYGFLFCVSLSFYIMLSFLLLSGTFRGVKKPTKKRIRFLLSNSLNYYAGFKSVGLRCVFWV